MTQTLKVKENPTPNLQEWKELTLTLQKNLEKGHHISEADLSLLPLPEEIATGLDYLPNPSPLHTNWNPKDIRIVNKNGRLHTYRKILIGDTTHYLALLRSYKTTIAQTAFQSEILYSNLHIPVEGSHPIKNHGYPPSPKIETKTRNPSPSIHKLQFSKLTQTLYCIGDSTQTQPLSNPKEVYHRFIISPTPSSAPKRISQLFSAICGRKGQEIPALAAYIHEEYHKYLAQRANHILSHRECPEKAQPLKPCKIPLSYGISLTLLPDHAYFPWLSTHAWSLYIPSNAQFSWEESCQNLWKDLHPQKNPRSLA
jgi:hypothetical protein